MIVVVHNHGFFSNSSVRLVRILSYLGANRKLPEIVDSSQSWQLYKPNDLIGDITYAFFEQYNEQHEYSHFDIGNQTVPVLTEWANQFSDYRNIPYDIFNPLIQIYFTPVRSIRDLSKSIYQKYDIDLAKSCTVYFRGTDKRQETLIPPYTTFFNKMREIEKQHPGVQFLLLSDTSQFIKETLINFPNSTEFSENQTTDNNAGLHLTNTSNQNYLEVRVYLALVYLLANAKYLITCSSNGGEWLSYYRGHGGEIYQFLNEKWLN